jgi:oligopeptide transport system ATP-binding protein
LTIKTQLLECFQTHQKLPHKETVERAISLLKLVGIPAPETRLAQYPHQLSGGMRQRVMIAMALAMNPRILIADEPTTALDVTIQAQIIELLQKINQELKTSIILISHDLGVVAGLCHQVMVMYAGQMVETGPTTSLLTAPHHPYTLGLLQSVPRLDQDRQSLVAIDGQPPDLLSLPEGCAFLPRCPHKMHICHQAPPLLAITSGQSSRCWLAHPTCPIALPGRGERTGGQL